MKMTGNLEMCSIARSIDKIGDSWSLLILRDLGQGLSLFDELQKNLHIAPGVLSKRLAALTKEGLVKKELYQDNPPRAKYLLTEAGQDFQPVLVMIMAWGNKYCSPNGIDTQIVDSKTHKKITPLVIDAKTKQPLKFTRLIYSGGPGASAEKNKILKERNVPVVPAK